MTEESSCEPWTCLAREKKSVERALADIVGLNYIIIRPAIVYGQGDKSGLSKYWRIILFFLFLFLFRRVDASSLVLFRSVIIGEYYVIL